MTAVHEDDRRIVIYRIGDHAFEEAQVVGMFGKVRVAITEPCPALPMLLESKDRTLSVEIALQLGHAKWLSAFENRGRQWLAIALVEQWLVIE